MRTFTLCALLAIAFALTLTRPESARTAFPGRNGMIAYTTSSGGSSQSIVTGAVGNPGMVTALSPGPDEGAARYSPDGDWIAYFDSPGGNFDVYIMRPDGSDIRRLTDDPGMDARAAWAPSGDKLVFHSSRDGNVEIYSMNSDGTGQTRLTNHPAHDSEPHWSPNGDKIVWSSNRAVAPNIVHLWAMNSDGSNQQQLTSGFVADIAARWSPDGTQILFMRVDGTQNDRYDVYVIDADGSNLKQLSHSGKDGLPAWSPDGEKILFSSDRNGLGDLYIMNADGSDEQPLTNAPANLEGDVDWQPINGLIGDTDCDGDVEADDSQAVLAYLVGLAVPDCVFTLGNVICDEPPVLADAVAILQYVAFNESRVPAYCLPIGT